MRRDGRQVQEGSRRQKEAVKRVVLSDDAKAAYEEMARERDAQQRRYAAHLPADKAR